MARSLSPAPSGVPRVSVIVPVYNRRAFIRRCLASIAGTRYPNLEIVLIDDGSSDGSWELIQNCAAEQGETIRALHHPRHQNRGISASRNLGLQRATGRYVAFLDSDDEYSPHRFDQCLGLLEADPALHAIYEPVWIENDSGNGARVVPSRETIRCIETNPLAWLFRNDWWHTSSLTVRRDSLLRLGLFREDLPVGEDTELWMRLAATGAIRSSDQAKPVATVHRHTSGHSWDKISASQRARFYRKSLLTTLGAIKRRPSLYLPHAREVYWSRHFKALEDEIDRLTQSAPGPALFRLGIEAALVQPSALFSKRSLGNLLGRRGRSA